MPQIGTRQLDIRDQNVAVERVLAATENPRHRYLLQSYLRHRYLESAGRYLEIFDTAMTVEHPVYRFSLIGQPRFTLAGRPQVEAVYRHWTQTDQCVFYVEDETVAVGGHLIVGRGIGYQQRLGSELAASGLDADADSMYLAHGIGTVVASDFSAGRRALASACGADIVVDPGVDSPYEAAGDHDYLRTLPDAVGLAISTMEKLRPLPAPWHQVWRAGETLGQKPKHPVIFECVGVPGILDGIIASAPLYSRVVVAGVCAEPDTFRPVVAINKEIDLRFVVGYTPLEFRDTLHLLAEGKVAAAPIATGTVGLAGVEAAFAALAAPGKHAKIIIEPASAAAAPS